MFEKNIPQKSKNAIVVIKWKDTAIEAFLKNGFQVIVIADKNDVIANKIKPETLNRLHRIYRINNCDSVQEITNIFSDLSSDDIQISLVLSTTEGGQFAAGLLRSLLEDNLNGIKGVNLARDKRTMKRAMNRAGMRTAKFFGTTIARLEEDKERIVAEVGFPMILKLASGVGTKCTYKLEKIGDFLEVKKELQESLAIGSEHLILEEFIEGHEFHVDGVWRNSEPLAFSVSKYIVPRFGAFEGLGLNGSYSLPRAGREALYTEILEMNKRANIVVGLSEGLTHLELFMKSNGEIVFSEIATRLGGALVEEMVECIFDLNPYEILSDSLVSPPVKRAHFPDKNEVFGFFNLNPKANGRISNMPDLATLREIERDIVRIYQKKNIGDRFESADLSAWCLQVFLKATSERSFLEKAFRINECAVIEVTPFDEVREGEHVGGKERAGEKLAGVAQQ